MFTVRHALAVGAVALTGALPLATTDRLDASPAPASGEVVATQSTTGRIGGTTCRKAGQARTTSVGSFRCTKVGRALRWRRVGVTPTTTTTVAASTSPATSLSNSAELSPVGECKIGHTGADGDFSLIRTGFPRVPDAALRRQDVVVVVLPVDFPNLTRAVPASTLLDPIAKGVTDYYARVSSGRLRFVWRLADTTTRMPYPVERYNLNSGNNGFEYMQEVLSAADPSVDFSEADFVLALHPETATSAQISSSPAQQMTKAFKFRTNEGDVYRTTFTSNATASNQGWMIIAHEFGHGLGLPDLYDYGGGPGLMGTFDLMGEMSRTSPIELTAWSKWQLGFIEDSQVHCLNAGQAARLWISHVSAGTNRPEMIVVPTSSISAVVIEARRRERFDANAAFAPVSDGLLIYEVNSSFATGRSPLRAVSKPGAMRPGGLDGLFGLNERVQVGRYSFASIESGPWGHVVEVKTQP